MSNYFVLQNDTVLHRALNAISRKYASSKDVTPKKTYAVQIKLAESKRSVAQNNLYFAWCTDIANQSGETKTNVHEHLSGSFLPHQVFNTKWGFKTRRKSTKDLNTKEFTDYLMRVDEWARDMGYDLSCPDDYHYALNGGTTGSPAPKQAVSSTSNGGV